MRHERAVGGPVADPLAGGQDRELVKLIPDDINHEGKRPAPPSVRAVRGELGRR